MTTNNTKPAPLNQTAQDRAATRSGWTCGTMIWNGRAFRVEGKSSSIGDGYAGTEFVKLYISDDKRCAWEYDRGDVIDRGNVFPTPIILAAIEALRSTVEAAASDPHHPSYRSECCGATVTISTAIDEDGVLVCRHCYGEV